MKKKLFKLVAHTVLLSLGYQLVFPVCAYALTTGPSQPEVQSFEPVGTTEMVDMFSGDFNYNIPLLDVEGYPVNIFYHSGVGMEQEASWVGLGWNINPGEINRTVRGLPDDFNGETIEKFTKIKPEQDIRIGIGANVAAEIYGKDLKISVGEELYIGSNNYKGLSAGVNLTGSVSIPYVSAGVGIGIGSQSGADIDFNAQCSIGRLLGSAMSDGLAVRVGTGFNSRTGLKDLSLTTTTKYTSSKGSDMSMLSVGLSGTTTIPIGIRNYVPVITNKMTQKATQGQLKFGLVGYGAMASAYFNVSMSNTTVSSDGSRKGYGYLYLENALKEDILDFSRDKDGVYNSTVKNLPAGSLAYDLYTINGQGTGGMFRPFRNDIGTFYDPYVDPEPEDVSKSLMLEGAIGAIIEFGTDITTIRSRNSAGLWDGKQMNFSGNITGELFEKVFFKKAGELTYNQQQDAAGLSNKKVQYVTEDMLSLKNANNSEAVTLPSYRSTDKGQARLLWNNSVLDRSSRATQISYLTAEQASIPDAATENQINSFSDGTSGHFYDPKQTSYKRLATRSADVAYNSRKSQISEFTQTAPDGRRYVYGIPAVNHAQKEATFAVDAARADLDRGYVAYNPGTDNTKSNGQGRDNYYSHTITPMYAHSHLLTSLLSADYVDIMGDGPTDDDLGTFVKYNYNLTDNDYRWRAPYSDGTAQYNPGYWSDTRDDKGSYVIGSRQQWYLRSIESKNYVAEFYTSKRQDARGVKEAVYAAGHNIRTPLGAPDLNVAKGEESYSYKLDSIKLYNKHDRYINKDQATPVKTVLFKYDYSQCKHVPNTLVADTGKLTLKQIFIRYGNSDKNLLSPYTFTYNTTNPDYDFAAKDRWGNHKPVVPGIHNYEFPYTEQPSSPEEAQTQNDALSAWNLVEIKLPSGGKIHVDYESDDYAFVQDKRAMQMFRILGVGNSKSMARKNTLYQGIDDINDYVYFKRRRSHENPALSFRDNYLEGQELLYYSFALDITGNGKFEHVNGYGKIDDVGYCDNDPNSEYGYVKLKRDNAGNMSLHPAAIYGINMARYYLPQLFFPGGSETGSGDLKQLWKGMIGSGEELINMFAGQNPFKSFIRKQKARYLNINNSWIRLDNPDLVKKGGGIRVKRLTLSDNWKSLAGDQAEDGVYGKTYDYTTHDDRYGTISSGVASYEPLIGGDENPFRKPVPYTADKGRLMPAIDFFQEEPLGESFFPAAVVGYSRVTVRSIHEAYGKSSLAEDEHLFFTYKDYPFIVDFSEKTGPGEISKKSLRQLYREERVLQGYMIVLNDMHGKAKAINNYVLHKADDKVTRELITGVTYKYFDDNTNSKRLNNNVTALVRIRGTVKNYELRQTILGQEMDFVTDSRFRSTETNSNTISLNVNVIYIPPFQFVPITTIFKSMSSNTNIFKSLVSTKVIQQYGILKSVEQFDHGAKTTTENLVFDAETGDVLLSRTNNEFGDQVYNRKHPAYLAYEGMRPAYTNTGYEEIVDSFVVNEKQDGYIYTDNLDRFSPGDELMVKVRTAQGELNYKLWVQGKGIDTGSVGDPYSEPSTPVIKPADSGSVLFWRQNQGPGNGCLTPGNYLNIKVYPAGSSTAIASGGLVEGIHFSETDFPSCGDRYCYTVKLPPGNYTYTATATGIAFTVSGSFRIIDGECVSALIQKCVETPIPGDFAKVAGGDGKRCALQVAPRFKRRMVGGSSSVLFPWPFSRTVFSKAKVTVLRSGRRNNLDKDVQQTTFSITPYTGIGANPNSYDNLVASASNLFSRSAGVLSVKVNTFTDTAQIYAPFTNSFGILPTTTYARFNAYVLGLRGNYRPKATYAPVTGRAYSEGHSRFDGQYTITQPFWSFSPDLVDNPGLCYTKSDAFSRNNLSGTAFWKRASMVTRYDVHGNALEELDAVGNYSSAIYGYNRSLPVAVAYNVKDQHFMFDGFEDYNMLVPKTAGQLFAKMDMSSPFGTLFGDLIPNVVTGYPSEQPITGDVTSFTRYGQAYNLHNSTPAGNMVITAEDNHTGFYALKSTASQTYAFSVADALQGSTTPFRLMPGKKYLLNLWAKSVTPGTAITGSMFRTKINSALYQDMQVKVENIDGWYQLEATIDLTTTAASSVVTLSLPANVYVDDIRSMPAAANMKSFVYDPVNFRLVAQLDENHMATFFEYDQEGLLVRTKKETDKGIVTISESRRANTKK